MERTLIPFPPKDYPCRDGKEIRTWMNGYETAVSDLSKPKDDKIWSVFEKAYEKYRSKQIEDHYETHKKEVIDIIKTLFPF